MVVFFTLNALPTLRVMTSGARITRFSRGIFYLIIFAATYALVAVNRNEAPVAIRALGLAPDAPGTGFALLAGRVVFI